MTKRDKMLEVKVNFTAGKKDLKCSLGCDRNKDQEDILECFALKKYDDTILNYNDINDTIVKP